MLFIVCCLFFLLLLFVHTTSSSSPFIYISELLTKPPFPQEISSVMTIETFKDRTLRGIQDLKKDIAETCAAQEAKVHQLKVAAQTSGLGGLLNTILHPSPAPEGKIKDGTFTNWGGNQSFKPTEILNPETLEDLIDIVHMSQKTGKKIRCAGSGHSWSSSSVTDGYLVVMNKMQKVFEPVFDSEKGWTVELETGVLVKDLDDAMRRHNPPLALPSNVVLDSVSRKNTNPFQLALIPMS